ncbi:hypothetical protein RB653_008761 [Dictyostelium firmibasis]|uniref:Uncharacterized protein n=1 Tax=Dictyostelium firmibasis TaxID=79012 RepID=A0AAN7YWU5_9MYCE
MLYHLLRIHFVSTSTIINNHYCVSTNLPLYKQPKKKKKKKGKKNIEMGGWVGIF